MQRCDSHMSVSNETMLLLEWFKFIIDQEFFSLINAENYYKLLKNARRLGTTLVELRHAMKFWMDMVVILELFSSMIHYAHVLVYYSRFMFNSLVLLLEILPYVPTIFGLPLFLIFRTKKTIFVGLVVMDIP